MITRKEAEELIEKQMKSGGEIKIKYMKEGNFVSYPTHYGKCELKELLDAIYK